MTWRLGVALLSFIAYSFGVMMIGKSLKQAEWDRSVIATREAQDKALEQAAKAIAQIEVKNVTIKQEAKTIMRDVPVYRDCVHDKRVLDRINAAIQSADPGKLPASGASE